MRKHLLSYIILLFFLIYVFTGIDKEPYYDEGKISWFPVLFIKRGISFELIFEVPASPSDILRNSTLVTKKNKELSDYCKIRYGNELIECREKISNKMIINGFYIPD